MVLSDVVEVKSTLSTKACYYALCGSQLKAHEQ